MISLSSVATSAVAKERFARSRCLLASARSPQAFARLGKARTIAALPTQERETAVGPKGKRPRSQALGGQRRAHREERLETAGRSASRPRRDFHIPGACNHSSEDKIESLGGKSRRGRSGQDRFAKLSEVSANATTPAAAPVRERLEAYSTHRVRGAVSSPDVDETRQPSLQLARTALQQAKSGTAR